MVDAIYEHDEVDLELRPIFEQLAHEFGAGYQVWSRTSNMGRFVSAAVLLSSSRVAVIIALRNESRHRTSPLTATEIQYIRDYLSSNATVDLEL